VNWLTDAAGVLLERVLGGGPRPARAPVASLVVSRAANVTVGREAVDRCVVGPGDTSRVVIGRIANVVVSEAPRPAWDAKGWEREQRPDGVTYTGSYEAAGRGGPSRRFRGRIEERGRRIDAYVADPPEAIRRHPKGPCFALVEAPWFKVHWHRAPNGAATSKFLTPTP
jgi:hypothetical protein